MAGERVKLVVSERTTLGSSESRRLRKQGLIPGILYGHSKPVSIAVPERDLRAALTTGAGMHAVLDVTVDGGGSHSAILKEFQVSKVRGKLTHIDLQEVRLDVAIQTAVTITLVGEPVGVKEGGMLTQVTNTLNVEALPLEVPQHLEIDVSEMQIGDSMRLTELVVPSGVTLLDDPETTVLATVSMQTRAEETDEVAEDGEAAEGAEGAEGEEGDADGDADAEAGEDSGDADSTEG